MKKLYLITLIILAVSRIGSGMAQDETPRHPEDLILPDLVFEMPKATETRLTNGIRVLLFENHDLPLISLSANMSGGTYYLPIEQHSACRLLGWVWDEGGIGDLSPEEVESRVAALGMSLYAGLDKTSAYVQASMVRDDLTEGSALWRDMLLNPRFSEERLERAKARLLKDIQGLNDDPDQMAEIWFSRLLSGEDSPEGHVQSREELESVSREDLLSLHEKFVCPQRAVIGVSGDITMSEAVALLESLLGDWQSPDDVQPLVPQIWKRTPRPGVYLLPGDYAQCYLRIGRGLPDLTDTNVDYPEVRLLDFGVGFLRIFYRARGEGLSYGTTSRLTADMDRGKVWAFGSTSPENIIDLISVVREEIMNLESNPLGDDEVNTARTFILGTQIRSMETAQQIVSARMDEIVLGRPDGYTANLVAGLQAANPERVAEAAARYMDFGEQPVLLVVGSPEGGVESLEALGLGPVTVLESIEFGK